RPTINSRPSGSPNDGTGALNQPGSRARAAARKLTRRGQRGQSGPGWVGERASPAGAGSLPLSASIVKIVVAAPRRHRGRTVQELRGVMARLARRRTLGGIAAKLGLQFHQIGEDVGLAPQLVGD